jgi:ectoine hydroxylase-related dioxygenase (phytanoyl-CoA dioxygenase family)
MSKAAANRLLDRGRFLDLTPSQQQDYFDRHGFLWVPDAVPADEIERVLTDLDAHRPRSSIVYSAEWPAASAVNLITNVHLLGAVRACIGHDVRFFHGVFGQWLNHGAASMRRGRQALHRDFRDDGVAVPRWCNSAIYCLDLEPGLGPLWVVPGTHKLPLTAPDTDLEHLADQALLLCARTGDAAIFHCLTVHAGGTMPDRRPRPSFFFSYRPGGYPAAADTRPWPAAIVVAASAGLRPLLVS